MADRVLRFSDGRVALIEENPAREPPRNLRW
jgi:hypothetical protein